MQDSLSIPVVGFYATRAEAIAATDALEHAGFSPDQITVIATHQEPLPEKSTATEKGVTGALAGVGIGSLIGIGVMVGAEPALVATTVGSILSVTEGGTDLASPWIASEPDSAAACTNSEQFVVRVEPGDRTTEAQEILDRCAVTDGVPKSVVFVKTPGDHY